MVRYTVLQESNDSIELDNTLLDAITIILKFIYKNTNKL